MGRAPSENAAYPRSKLGIVLENTSDQATQRITQEHEFTLCSQGFEDFSFGDLRLGLRRSVTDAIHAHDIEASSCERGKHPLIHAAPNARTGAHEIVAMSIEAVQEHDLGPAVHRFQLSHEMRMKSCPSTEDQIG